jgi:hypothetical protein
MKDERVLAAQPCREAAVQNLKFKIQDWLAPAID